MEEQKKNNKKILIVEDEAIQTRLLKETFLSKGFEVIEASNGEEGLKTALKERPDLILLDIILPKMDGITVLKNLRKDSWGKNAPVIVLTNLVETEKEKEALKQGVSDFFVKANINLDQIAEKVAEKLKMDNR